MNKWRFIVLSLTAAMTITSANIHAQATACYDSGGAPLPVCTARLSPVEISTFINRAQREAIFIAPTVRVPEITQALINLTAKGRTVVVLIDKHPSQLRNTFVTSLRNARATVLWVNGVTQSVLYLDGETMVTGPALLNLPGDKTPSVAILNQAITVGPIIAGVRKVLSRAERVR